MRCTTALLRSSRRAASLTPRDAGPPVKSNNTSAARVTARLSVEDLEELFDIELPERDDVETVGGLLGDALGRVPIPGARVEAYGVELIAESAGGRRNRIDTVLVTRLPQPSADEDELADTTAAEEPAHHA